MNWLLITVGAIFLISIIVGICKGAIKIAVSLATTIVTLFLVFFATPYVAKAIAKYTPLDDLIKSQVVSTMANVAADDWMTIVIAMPTNTNSSTEAKPLLEY